MTRSCRRINFVSCPSPRPLLDSIPNTFDILARHGRICTAEWKYSLSSMHSDAGILLMLANFGGLFPLVLNKAQMSFLMPFASLEIGLELSSFVKPAKATGSTIQCLHSPCRNISPATRLQMHTTSARMYSFLMYKFTVASLPGVCNPLGAPLLH